MIGKKKCTSNVYVFVHVNMLHFIVFAKIGRMMMIYAIVFGEAKPKFITWTVTAKSKNGCNVNVMLIFILFIETQ